MKGINIDLIKLDALLVEGLDSGQPIDVTDEYIQRKRAELLERMEERKRASQMISSLTPSSEELPGIAKNRDMVKSAMTVTLDLTKEEEKRLRDEARAQGLELGDLLHKMVADALSTAGAPELGKQARVAGLHAGVARIAEDFDNPLPDSFRSYGL